VVDDVGEIRPHSADAEGRADAACAGIANARYVLRPAHCAEPFAGALGRRRSARRLAEVTEHSELDLASHGIHQLIEVPPHRPGR
jgi:hypothetical protein